MFFYCQFRNKLELCQWSSLRPCQRQVKAPTFYMHNNIYIFRYINRSISLAQTGFSTGFSIRVHIKYTCYTERIKTSASLIFIYKLRRMGTQRVQMKVVLNWLVCWSCRNSKRFFYALEVLVSPVQHILYFFTVHYINSFVLIAQQAGQAVIPGRLSLRMYLWSCQLF
jgi:hypothetical protein